MSQIKQNLALETTIAQSSIILLTRNHTIKWFKEMMTCEFNICNVKKSYSSESVWRQIL